MFGVIYIFLKIVVVLMCEISGKSHLINAKQGNAAKY